MVDAAQLVHAGNESTHEAEIDECDEQGRSSSRAQTEQSGNSPGAGEDGNDEEDEDGVGRELIILLEARDEPCLREVSLDRRICRREIHSPACR